MIFPGYTVHDLIGMTFYRFFCLLNYFPFCQILEVNSCVLSITRHLCAPALNRGDVKDTEMEAIIDSVVDSLFSVFVTLGESDFYQILFAIQSDLINPNTKFCLIFKNNGLTSQACYQQSM